MPSVCSIALLATATLAMTAYAGPESSLTRRSPLAARQNQGDINDFPPQCNSACTFSDRAERCLEDTDPARCLCAQELIDMTFACGTCVVEDGSFDVTADELEQTIQDQIAACKQLGVDLDEPETSSGLGSNSGGSDDDDDNNNGAVSVASYCAGLAAAGLALGVFA